MFDARLRPLVDRILDPVGAFVARRGVTANQVSFAGFGLGIAAAIAILVRQAMLALDLTNLVGIEVSLGRDQQHAVHGCGGAGID